MSAGAYRLWLSTVSKEEQIVPHKRFGLAALMGVFLAGFALGNVVPRSDVAHAQ